MITLGHNGAMSLGKHDSWLLASFGGPDGLDDVLPFLQNVTRGRNVPPERLREVALQYDAHGGRSPINGQNQALRAAVDAELAARGHVLPGAWGNRNWTPYLHEALVELRDRGHTNTLCVVTSAFSSYSGCRQYHDDIASAQQRVAGAPAVRRVRVYWNHPGFLGAVAARIEQARRDAGLTHDVHTVFTAHSIPVAQAETCDYQSQLTEAMSLIGASAQLTGPVELAFQSRSGPPHIAWLEPDIGARLAAIASSGTAAVLVVPLGFVSDHMEVIHDLDELAAGVATAAGLRMVRAATVGTHPQFVSMLVDLLEEAAGLRSDRPALGVSGPRPDACQPDCCLVAVPQGQPATRS